MYFSHSIRIVILLLLFLFNNRSKNVCGNPLRKVLKKLFKTFTIVFTLVLTNTSRSVIKEVGSNCICGQYNCQALDTSS